MAKLSDDKLELLGLRRDTTFGIAKRPEVWTTKKVGTIEKIGVAILRPINKGLRFLTNKLKKHNEKNSNTNR